MEKIEINESLKVKETKLIGSGSQKSFWSGDVPCFISKVSWCESKKDTITNQIIAFKVISWLCVWLCVFCVFWRLIVESKPKVDSHCVFFILILTLYSSSVHLQRIVICVTSMIQRKWINVIFISRTKKNYYCYCPLWKRRRLLKSLKQISFFLLDRN